MQMIIALNNEDKRSITDKPTFINTNNLNTINTIKL